MKKKDHKNIINKNILNYGIQRGGEMGFTVMAIGGLISLVVSVAIQFLIFYCVYRIFAYFLIKKKIT